MPVDQQAIQTAVTQQGGAQPAIAGGAVAPTFNVAGNPNTAYNFAPPQANAAGEWWNPQGGNIVSPIVQALINQTYNRQYPTTPTPAPVVPTTPTGPNVPTPAVVVGPPLQDPRNGVPVAAPSPQYPYGQYPTARNNMGYLEDMGGEGSYCVEEDMILLDRDNQQYWADELEPGMEFLCHLPELGFHSSKVVAKGKTVWQDCVEITTELGAKLVCSSNTPFTFVGASKDLNEGEWAHAKDMLGKLVYVKRGDQLEAEKIAIVSAVGPKRVVPLDFGGKSFAAGVSSTALIFSHNIRKLPGSGVDLVALRDNIAQQFGVSWGDTPYITTVSQMPGYVPPTPSTPAPVPTSGGTATPNAPTPSTPTPTPSVDPAAPYGRDSRGTPYLAPHPGATEQPGANSWWQSLLNLGTGIPVFNEGQFDPWGGIKADWQEFIKTGN